MARGGLRGGTLQVLVVDDDAKQLAACARRLRACECEVTTASSPGEAVEMLELQHFDLVLSDQRMPHMSGTELLAEARRVQAGTRRVVMSAFAEVAEILPAINAGDVHRFLAKPIQPEELLEGLEESSKSVRCLVVDRDERRARRLCDALAEEESLKVMCATEANGTSADLIVLVAPDSAKGIEETVAGLRSRCRETSVMVALDPEDVEDSPSYLAAGVDDLLWLPVGAREVRLRYQTWRAKRRASQEAARVRSEVAAHGSFPQIIGDSEAMRRVFHQAHRVAPSDASVLIGGETGTGKEMMARALHDLSHRRSAPFLAVNLSAIPESLVESELFGHERGAFTGARSSRQGRIESADGGTLFLDEVGDLSPSVQVKLLRVLEQRTFERLGSSSPRRADFRLICATHRNLEQMVADGEFREDLYYRINVVRLEMPPLRERGEDIRLLAEHFLAKFSEKYSVDDVTVGERAMRALMRFEWPGNVRQLQHVIERAVAMSHRGSVIEEDQLWSRSPRVSFRSKIENGVQNGRGLREILADIERTMLVEALERYGGNQKAAAEKLKIPRQTLQNRLKKYGL